MKRLVSLVLIASLASPAMAHDQWLEVEPFRATTASRVRVYLLLGEQFREAESAHVRKKERYTRFELRTGTAKQDLLSQIHEDGEPFLVLGNADKVSGTSMLALDAAPRDIELAAAKFQDYLLEERLVEILSLRADRNAEDVPGRERYARCLKAIFQIGAKLDDAVTRPIGQELEVVPASNPYGVALGQTLTVQVLFRGKPLVKGAVAAANRWHSDIKTQHVRTDAQGRATFHIDRGGDWMIRLVHMEASNQPGADWLSWWTSLTFSLAD